MNKQRIGVIFGGKGSEREVSLASGRNVYNTLDRSRFDVTAVFWDQSFRFWEIAEVLVIRNTCKEIEDRLEAQGKRITYEELSKHIDLAFLTTHGKYGDDGCLQGLLELLRIPYTGSGVLGAAVGLDKILQRPLLKTHENVIHTPPYLVAEPTDDAVSVSKKVEDAFGFSCVVKPSREGSTVGVVKVDAKEEMPQALSVAREFDRRIIIEPYLKGREFSCMVIGNGEPKALLPTEVKYEGDIFTYDHKYLPGASQKITPMEVDQYVTQSIQQQSEVVYRLLAMRDYARIDGFVLDDLDVPVVVTDPNSAASTGLSPSSWTFHQAAKEGMLPQQFLTYCVDMVMKRTKL